VIRVLVIQNDPLAPSGHFGYSLVEAGAELTTLHVYQEEERVEINVQDYQGLVVLGGRINAFDEEQQPLTNYVIQTIQAFHHQQKPTFGICLGAQFLAKALNTGFRSNNGWEVGFTELRKTLAGSQDTVFSTINDQCRLFEMHEDSFFLPENSELLMSGTECTNQAFKVDDYHYGVQFHPEATSVIVKNWVEYIRSKPNDQGQDMAKQMLTMQPEDFQKQKETCQKLAVNWLALVKVQSLSGASL